MGAVLTGLLVLAAVTADVFHLEGHIVQALRLRPAGAWPALSQAATTTVALKVLLSLYLFAVAMTVLRAVRLQGCGDIRVAAFWERAGRLLLACAPVGLVRGLLALVVLRLLIRLSERALGLVSNDGGDLFFILGAVGLMLLALSRRTALRPSRR